MSSLCQWFCTCRCIGKRNKDFLNANAKAPICRPNMATGGTGNVTNQPTKGQGLLLPKPTYTCDICGQEGLNEDDMKTHVLLEHVEGEISCPFCDLEGTSAEEMNLHVNAQHLDFSRPYKENSQDVITPTKESLNLTTTDANDKGNKNNVNENPQNIEDDSTLSNSKQELNLMNTQKKNDSKGSLEDSSNQESIESYMPLQEVRNASEVSMDTTSSYQSNTTSSSSSPESEISLGNRETSSTSGNNNTSSYEASSSCSTTPEEINISQCITAREIKINVIKGSPKKVVSGEEVDFKIGSDCDEQSRKRAKLYLHVPQPHSPRRQINNPGASSSSSSSSSASAATSAPRVPSMLDSHASTAELHRFAHLSSPKFPSHHGLGGIDDLVETDGVDYTPEDDGELDTFTCPLCSWNTRSPGAIVRHVNTDHLDVISPSAHPQRSAGPITTDTENNILSAKAGTSSPQFACPICNLDAKTGSSLELHVNSEHAELLSPAKPLQPQVSTPMSVDSNGSGLTCPMCGMECSDTNDLTAHVDGHFSSEHTPDMEEADSQLAQELDRRERAALKLQEQKDFERLQDLYGMSNKGGYKKQAERSLERAVCNGEMTVAEYHSKKADVQSTNTGGADDGHSCTKDLIPNLKEYYRNTTTNVVRVWLCSGCDHYAGSYGDKGWGCGYRNLQMLLSCLAKSSTYQQVLFNGRPVIPSIPKIQRLIEAAWQKGFDLQGSEQLGGKVINTTKWIGATEIVATLSALKIKCQLCDFHAPTGKDGTHPRLFEWVKNYFHSSTDEFRPPLYLQHQGHSRTIIGIEELKDGSLRLLLFDPSCNRKQMQTFHEEINANLMRTIRRTLHSMRAKQYQIVATVGILTDKEYEDSKVMKSDRIL